MARSVRWLPSHTTRKKKSQRTFVPGNRGPAGADRGRSLFGPLLLPFRVTSKDAESIRGDSLPLPFALDFYPLEAPEFTRIHPFFDNLRKGKLTTTNCTNSGAVHWQPRVVCPKCNSDSLEWIDLPRDGELFAFTEVRAGAPIGFEKDVPFVTGLVRLKGTGILLTSRIDGAKYEELKIGDKVHLKVIELPDKRVWFRFAPQP